MKKEDIKVGGVYVAKIDGVDCHVEVLRVKGGTRIGWEVKIVQAPVGYHILLGKKQVFDGAVRFKSIVVEDSGDGVTLPGGTSSVNQNAEAHGTDVEDEKRPDPTPIKIVKRSPLDRLRSSPTKGISVPDVASPKVEPQDQGAGVTPSVGVVERSFENPDCEGYAPNLATGVCRCKSCRSKPHGGRTRRPFSSATSVPPTTPTAEKGRPPTTESSATGSGLTKKTKSTKGLSSSSLGSVGTEKTIAKELIGGLQEYADSLERASDQRPRKGMEGEDSKRPTQVGTNTDQQETQRDAPTVGSGSSSLMSGTTDVSTQCVVITGISGQTPKILLEGKRSILPDTPFGGSTSAPHLEVRAYAGTGKSTTVVQGLIKVKGGTPGIVPSDEQAAVWEKLGVGKSDSVRVSAFSNAISNEMGQKIHDAGLNGKGVEAVGIHKLGFAAVRAQFGYLPPNGYAVTDLVCKKLGGEFRDLKAQKGMLVKINATADLVSLCKQTMTAPTEAGLEQLAYRYDVELDDQRSSVFQLVPDVLEACKKPQGKIAFDDMIWLPLVLGLHVPKVDHQIIDESQDLNRMQQELMYLAGHRVTFVGDEHQAIMGFAGADSESMKRMYKTLADGPMGCDRLPLTVTRRCGKAIVKEAQKYVPGFQAHESNGEGVVRDALWTWKGTGSDRVLVPWEKTYGPLVQDGAMVVCRTNAPTVSECFRFLARGIKAVVLGRKVGQGLIDLVKKAEKARDGIGEDAPVAKLIAWLSDWLTKETAKEQAKKFPSEGKIQNLEDKYECLVTFAKSDCARTSEVITRINTVFADKKCPRCGKPYDVDARVCDVPACGGVSLVLPGGVKFSSIHKSKGLEAKQVIYLRPPGTGMQEDKMQAWELEQENNLRYVAVTRAISELIYVG